MEQLLGTNSMLEQPIAVLGEWKHSYQTSNIAAGTHQTLFSSHAELPKKTSEISQPIILVALKNWLCIFNFLIFCTNACQSLSMRGARPAIEPSGFPPFRIVELALKAMDKSEKQRKLPTFLLRVIWLRCCLECWITSGYSDGGSTTSESHRFDEI